MADRINEILMDVDDCIVPTDGKTTPDFYSGLVRIRDYQEMLPRIGLCSGRDRNYIEAITFVTGLSNWWSVIESGIALFRPSTKELLLNPALTSEIREAFEEIRRKRLPAILQRFPTLFLYPGNMINIALERQNGLPVEVYYNEIREDFSDLIEADLIRVHHSNIAVDISPAGIDKASGILHLAKLTGITPEHILGIGDSKGDFPMLRMVQYTGCPSNASVECREMVLARKGYVSDLPYASGVADVIRHYRVLLSKS